MTSLLMIGRLLLVVTLIQECQKVLLLVRTQEQLHLPLATGEASMPIPQSVKVTFKGNT